MKDDLAVQVITRLEEAAQLYHRLIVLVAPPGTGKTAALREVAKGVGAPVINVNLELSRRMLDLTERQRALKLHQILRDIVTDARGDVVVLDNTQILFDVLLKQDPLPLLLGISRNKTVVVAWDGAVEGGFLTYAAPGHREYRRYPVRDFLAVSPEINT